MFSCCRTQQQCFPEDKILRARGKQNKQIECSFWNRYRRRWIQNYAGWEFQTHLSTLILRVRKIVDPFCIIHFDDVVNFDKSLTSVSERPEDENINRIENQENKCCTDRDRLTSVYVLYKYYIKNELKQIYNIVKFLHFIIIVSSVIDARENNALAALTLTLITYLKFLF